MKVREKHKTWHKYTALSTIIGKIISLKKINKLVSSIKNSNFWIHLTGLFHWCPFWNFVIKTKFSTNIINYYFSFHTPFQNANTNHQTKTFIFPLILNLNKITKLSYLICFNHIVDIKIPNFNRISLSRLFNSMNDQRNRIFPFNEINLPK